MPGKASVSVPGFRASGVRGRRYGLALVSSDARACCSLMVTSNRIRAAPVELSLEHARDGAAQAIVVSSGNANAFTGARGTRDAARMAELAARELGVRKEDVIVNSTGIIGRFLEMEEIEELISRAVSSLSYGDEGFASAAEAMRTTDAFPKIASRVFESGEGEVRVTGIAKGAGMIAPQLVHGTMIALLLTNASVGSEAARAVLREAVEESFNMVVVDGDMSTNDMVVLLANGRVECDVGLLGRAVREVCLELARMMARDGEGAGKLFSVQVSGAASLEDARRVARAVAGSTLVKTAVFGESPNWGRVVAAVGYSGAEFDVDALEIRLRCGSELARLVSKGRGVAVEGSEELRKAAEILKNREFSFEIDLGAGGFGATAFGCDLGHRYVKLNAEYTS